MKKYKLKEFFSIQMDDKVVVGPCEVELSDEVAARNVLKIEPFMGESEKVEMPEAEEEKSEAKKSAKKNKKSEE